MKKIKFLLLILFWFPILSYSQDIENLNISDFIGTSRTLGLSGAQSALGADLGSFAINPASLGLFRRSELGLTSSFTSNRNKSAYLNNDFDSKNPFAAINNLGFALSTTDDSKTRGIKGFTLGVSYNRLATIKQKANINLFNPYNSFSTFLGNYTTEQDGLNSDFLNTNIAIDTIKNLGELGWKSFLIDTKDDSLFYGLADNGGVQQEIEILKEGFNSGWDFGLGINYEDFLYVGGTFKINQYELTFTKRIIESDTKDSIQNFNRYDYTQIYNSIGNGVGYSLGAIIKPLKIWRLGLSYHGKTTYNLTVNNTHILNDIDLNDTGNITLLKRFEFKELEIKSKQFSAPKLVLGNYIQFNKIGFMTTDLEYNFTSSVNETFKNTYRISNGFEFRKNSLRFRTGFGIKNNLYDSKLNGFWSLGTGIRHKAYFIDISLNRIKAFHNFNIYELTNNDKTSIEINRGLTTFSFSLGTKF